MDFKKIGLFLGGALVASTLQFAAPIADRVYQNFAGNTQPQRYEIEAKASAQNTQEPYILTVWRNGNSDLGYSILDDVGYSIYQENSAFSTVTRICGVHSTGSGWVVIVEDEGNELYSIFVNYFGGIDIYAIASSDSDFGDVVSIQGYNNNPVDGHTGGCW